MTARVLPRGRYRRRRPDVHLTGVCRVCGVPFQLTTFGTLMPHGPQGSPRCPGSGHPTAPQAFPTVLAAIRAAEVNPRLRLPEWQRLPLQPCEETP